MVSKFFNDHDFLICPSSSVVPFTHQTRWVKQIENKTFDNYVSWLMICGCISLINCPSLSIPTSIAKNGAPIGIQIIAPPYQEEKLLNFAKSIEKEINIPVQGGMDPKILLADKDVLKKEAIKYLDIFKDHPYIFNLGHGVLPETDPNMMDYLVKTVKDY